MCNRVGKPREKKFKFDFGAIKKGTFWWNYNQHDYQKDVITETTFNRKDQMYEILPNNNCSVAFVYLLCMMLPWYGGCLLSTFRSLQWVFYTNTSVEFSTIVSTRVLNV